MKFTLYASPNDPIAAATVSDSDKPPDLIVWKKDGHRRFFAPHDGKYIEIKTAVVVENVEVIP